MERAAVRQDEAAAVERRDVLQGLAHGVLGGQRDGVPARHERRGPAVHGNAQNSGNFIDHRDIQIRPGMTGRWVAALGHEHGVISVDGQEAGVRVGLAGVEVVDAFGDPLGLLGVVDDADIGTELRHAGNGSGVGVEGEGDLPRRRQADLRGAGAKDGVGGAEGDELIHAVVGTGDVHFDLKAVETGKDGLIKLGCVLH